MLGESEKKNFFLFQYKSWCDIINYEENCYARKTQITKFPERAILGLSISEGDIKFVYS